MPLFLLMTRLAPEALTDARGRRAMGKAWLKKVRTACPEVKWIAHYALLGPYDFISIVEALDNEAVARISIELGARGTVQIMTMPAIPIDQFIKKLGK